MAYWLLLTGMSVISHITADLQPDLSKAILTGGECVIRISHSQLYSWRAQVSIFRGSKSYVSLLLDQTDLPFIHLKKEAFPAIEKRLNTHAVNISKQLRKASKSKKFF